MQLQVSGKLKVNLTLSYINIKMRQIFIVLEIDKYIAFRNV